MIRRSILRILLKKKSIYNIIFDLVLILFVISIGAILGLMMDTSLFNSNRPYHSFTEIAFQNLRFAFIISILSSAIAYPVIIFNSLYLGILMAIGYQVIKLDVFLRVTIYHIPIELCAWVATLYVSRQFFYIYKYKKIKYKKIGLGLTVASVLYMVAAVIESLV